MVLKYLCGEAFIRFRNKVHFFILNKAVGVTLCLIFLSTILTILPNTFISAPQYERTLNWDSEYLEYVRLSIWIVIPMVLDTLWDLKKAFSAPERKFWLYSRLLFIISIIIPGIIQLYLPTLSDRNSAWSVQSVVLQIQSLYIISSICLSMYRPSNDLKEGDEVRGFNMILASIRLLLVFIVGRIFFLCHRAWPESPAFIALTGFFIIFSFLLTIVMTVRQLHTLWKETDHGRMTSHITLNDFLQCLVLIFYFSSLLIFSAVQLDGSITRTGGDVLASKYKIIMQIMLTIFVTVIPMRVAIFHARLESHRLLVKLDTIRYVSHEMRTPLNTVYLSLQFLENQLNELTKRTAKVESVGSDESETYPGGAVHTIYPLDEEDHSGLKGTYGSFLGLNERGPGSPPKEIYSSSKTMEYAPHVNAMMKTVCSLCGDKLPSLQLMVQQIKSGCDVCLATLNELLTADKLEDDKLSLDLAPLHPWQFVQETANSFNILAREKNIAYTVECPADPNGSLASLQLVGDLFKLAQVVRNFISNALKFTPEEGEVRVLIEVIDSFPRSPRKVSSRNSQTHLNDIGISADTLDPADLSERQDLSLLNLAGPDPETEFQHSYQEQEGCFLRVSVLDSGPGISAENQKKLFGRYVQFNAAQLQQGKGSGLGLWISKRIIELHEGKIGAHSFGEGQGSTFFFDLPLKHPTAPSPTISPLGPSGLSPLQIPGVDGDQPLSDSPPSTPNSFDNLLRKLSPVNFYRKRAALGSAHQANARYENPATISLGRFSTDNVEGPTQRRSTIELAQVDPELGGKEGDSFSEKVLPKTESMEAVSSPPRFKPRSPRNSPKAGYKKISNARPVHEKKPLGLLKGTVGVDLRKSTWEDGLNVLVVDDSVVNRRLLKSLLLGAGHRVDEAVDGQDFLDIFQGSKQHSNAESATISGVVSGVSPLAGKYDLVLMDDDMPRVIGSEATRVARQMGYTGLIVMVTGNAFENQVQHFLSCGANAVLQKPLNVTKLQQVLESII